MLSNWMFLTVGSLSCRHGTLKYLTKKTKAQPTSSPCPLFVLVLQQLTLLFASPPLLLPFGLPLCRVWFEIRRSPHNSRCLGRVENFSAPIDCRGFYPSNRLHTASILANFPCWRSVTTRPDRLYSSVFTSCLCESLSDVIF